MEVKNTNPNGVGIIKDTVKIHYNELIRLMNEDEATFDDSTLIKVYYNENKGNTQPLIAYEINSRFYSLRSQYYPIDFNGDINTAIDEMDVEDKDLKILEVYGHHLINYKGMGLTLPTS